jgi:hypothetical protein
LRVAFRKSGVRKSSGYNRLWRCAERGYYRSTNHIVADLLDRVNREDVSDIWGEDYVIWRDGRVMAAIHQRRNDEAKNVTLFNDPGNDPGAAHHSPLPGWPTYEQWIESSKGPLWYEPSNYQNSAR